MRQFWVLLSKLMLLVTLALGCNQPEVATIKAQGEAGSSTTQPSTADPTTANPAPASVVSGASVPKSPALPEALKAQRWSGMGMANLRDPVPGLPQSVRTQVTRVYRDSPADKAGLRPGDMVATANGKDIGRYQDIAVATRGIGIGESYALKIFRDSKPLDLILTYDAKPSDMKARLGQVFTDTEMMPFQVEEVTGPNSQKILKSSDLKGKILLLDFWATWCGSCRASMPSLEKLQQDFASSGVVVIGISSEERTVIDGFLKNKPLAYRVARDPEGVMKRDYEVSSLPTMYLVDQKGIIREVVIGAGHGDQLEKTIRSLL